MFNNLFAIYGHDFASQLSAPAKPIAPRAELTGTGTLVLSLEGTLSRDGRRGGTSTLAIAGQLRQAATDPSVARVVIRVDSPGGESAGAISLSDQVATTASIKPVIAYIENLCASAAYLAVCKSTSIIASRGALVGGIGTYAVVEDTSGLADRLGVKVHVIRAGEFKGMGTPGSAISESQQREIQRVVNSINDQFLAAVATGRKMTGDRLQIVSTGQVWIASDSQRYGLIDSMGTFDAALAPPVAAAPNATRRQGSQANDFYSRLAAQQQQRGEKFASTYHRSSER